MEERYVLPQALTQKAIAFAAGIQRKHLSRYLDEMVRDGFLTETKAHIEGEKQRMLAYYLAPRGWERAMGIKERLSKVRVPVKVAGRAGAHRERGPGGSDREPRGDLSRGRGASVGGWPSDRRGARTP